jgi:hypothetical protein
MDERDFAWQPHICWEDGESEMGSKEWLRIITISEHSTRSLMARGSPGYFWELYNVFEGIRVRFEEGSQYSFYFLTGKKRTRPLEFEWPVTEIDSNGGNYWIAWVIPPRRSSVLKNNVLLLIQQEEPKRILKSNSTTVLQSKLWLFSA